MNLRALETLLEIERSGAFAGAADRLGLTLSAVSLQMKTLERELQIDLFDRSHRPPTLTPAGRRVAAHGAKILRETAAIRAVGDVEGALHGDYRIGFVATASVRLMPRFLAEATRRHERAAIQVEIGLSADLVKRLSLGAIDAAVLTRTADLPPGLAFHLLRRERFAVAAPAAAGCETLADCVDRLPFIQFTPSTGIGILVSEHLAALGHAPRLMAALPSVEAVVGCVSEGIGFALLPEPDVRRYAGPDVAVLSPPSDGAVGAISRDLGLAAMANTGMADQLPALAALFEEN